MKKKECRIKKFIYPIQFINGFICDSMKPKLYNTMNEEQEDEQKKYKRI